MVIVMVRQLWLNAYYWTFKFNNGETMQGREYLLESYRLTSLRFCFEQWWFHNIYET